jgi:hypothetical protein
MFGRHEIQVPPGFKAVVNSRLDEGRPLMVGWRDQVYFVSFSPSISTVTTTAKCVEGVGFKADASIQLRIPREVKLPALLEEAGASAYNAIVKVTPDEVLKRHKLQQSLEATIAGFVRTKGFFDLLGRETPIASLSSQVVEMCQQCSLEATLSSIEWTVQVPSEESLAQLSALSAGDPAIKAVVDHFERASRYLELRDAIDAERKETDRANRQIAKAVQDERVAVEQADQEAKAAQRRHDAQERNAKIKENGAAFEFAYKTKRLEEAKALASKALEVAQAQSAEQAVARREKQLDMQLDLEREEKVAKIKAEQQEKVLAALSSVADRLGQIAGPNYTGVRTLVTGGGDSRDQFLSSVMGILTGLLDRAVDAGPGADPGGRPGRRHTERHRDEQS